jgi:hypothetical protein
MVTTDQYQHIVVSGLPYDRGFQHGQQLKDKILINIDHYNKPGKLPPRYEKPISNFHFIHFLIGDSDCLTVILI